MTDRAILAVFVVVLIVVLTIIAAISLLRGPPFALIDNVTPPFNDSTLTMTGVPALDTPVTLTLAVTPAFVQPELDAVLKFTLPSNFVLVSGNLTWTGPIDTIPLTHQVVVKAVKNGKFAISGTAAYAANPSYQRGASIYGTVEGDTGTVSDEPPGCNSIFPWEVEKCMQAETQQI